MDQEEGPKTDKKVQGQYATIMTKQAQSIRDLLYGIKPKHDKFYSRDKACIPSGQDSSILPTQVANA